MAMPAAVGVGGTTLRSAAPLLPAPSHNALAQQFSLPSNALISLKAQIKHCPCDTTHERMSERNAAANMRYAYLVVEVGHAVNGQLEDGLQGACVAAQLHQLHTTPTCAHVSNAYFL